MRISLLAIVVTLVVIPMQPDAVAQNRSSGFSTGEAGVSAFSGSGVVLNGEKYKGWPVDLGGDVQHPRPKSRDPIMMPVNEGPYERVLPSTTANTVVPQSGRAAATETDLCRNSADDALAKLSEINSGDSADIDFLKLSKSNQALATSLKLFDSSCFGDLASLPPELDTLGIKNLIGIFSFDGRGFCTGFRLSPAVAMTAMHCFYTKMEKIPYFDTKRIANINFHLLSAPTVAIPISRLELNQEFPNGEILDTSPIAHSDDYIFVHLSRSPGDFPIPDFDIVAPTRGDKLFLAGVTNYVSEATLTDSIRTVSRPICSISVAAADQCIFHGCQTSPGFSGSPLVRRSSRGKIEIVGIQIAAARDSGLCTETSQVQSMGNVGARIAEDAAARISK